VLVGHDAAVGEDQAVADLICALSLAKLTGHLGQSVHAVVVAGSAKRGKTTKEG